MNKKNMTYDNFKMSYRPKEAAKATGLSLSHINTIIKSGRLKSYKPSDKTRLIMKQDLEQYIMSTEEVQHNIDL